MVGLIRRIVWPAARWRVIRVAGIDIATVRAIRSTATIRTDCRPLFAEVCKELVAMTAVAAMVLATTETVAISGWTLVFR